MKNEKSDKQFTEYLDKGINSLLEKSSAVVVGTNKVRNPNLPAPTVKVGQAEKTEVKSTNEPNSRINKLKEITSVTVGKKEGTSGSGS